MFLSVYWGLFRRTTARPCEGYIRSLPFDYSEYREKLSAENAAHVLTGACPGHPLLKLVFLIRSAFPESAPQLLCPIYYSGSRMEVQLETIVQVDPGLPNSPTRDTKRKRKYLLSSETRKMPAILWSRRKWLEDWMNVWWYQYGLSSENIHLSRLCLGA